MKYTRFLKKIYANILEKSRGKDSLEQSQINYIVDSVIKDHNRINFLHAETNKLIDELGKKIIEFLLSRNKGNEEAFISNKEFHDVLFKYDWRQIKKDDNIRLKVLDLFYKSIDEFERVNNITEEKLNEIVNSSPDLGGKDIDIKEKHNQLILDTILAFNKAVGIKGVSYILVDKSHSKFIFLNNKKTVAKEYSHLEFYDFPLRLDENNSDESSTKDLFISCLNEMYQGDVNLSMLDINNAPEYLSYLPPNISFFSIDQEPKIQKQIESNEIDYIFCNAGEILFFTYIWRWLFRNAQYRGLNSNVDFSNFPIYNYTGEKSVWDSDFWIGNDHLKDKKMTQFYDFVNKLNNVKLSEKNAIKLIFSKEIVDGIDKKSEIRVFNFIKDWRLFGLSESEYSIDSLYAIVEFSLHVLFEIKRIAEKENIKIRYHDFLDENNLKSESEKVLSFIKMILEDENIDRNNIFNRYRGFASKNASIENMLHDSGFKVNPKTAEGKRAIHSFITLTGFLAIYIDSTKFNQYLSKTIFKQSEQRQSQGLTISNLLEILHKKVRFPIIPYFYQNALKSPIKVTYEHLLFPLFKSKKYGFRLINFPFHSDSVGFNCVVLCSVTLSPAWTNPFFNFTREESENTLSAIKLTETFYNHITKDLIDEGFIKYLVERTIEQATRESQYNSEAHEIKYLLELIDGKFPDWVLEKVRTYFNAIFGANDRMLEIFKDANKRSYYYDPDFDFGGSIEDFTKNAMKIAASIRHLVLSCLKKEFNLDSSNQYKKECSKRLVFFKNNEFDETYFNKIIPTEKKYFFFLALIASFRNILKHSPSESMIYVNINLSSIEILNNKKKDLTNIKKYLKNTESVEDNKSFKGIKGQGTSPTLNFYIKLFKEMNELFYFGSLSDFKGLINVPSDIKSELSLNEYFLTKIPIPTNNLL